MEWQPIETAPNDGESFDVWANDGKGIGRRFTDCEFDVSGHNIQYYNDWHEEMLTLDYSGFTASHWMRVCAPSQGA